MKTTTKRKEKQYPRLYSCSQQNAISVAKLAWEFCLELIARFTAASGLYTTAFVASMVAKVEETDKLPNDIQRKSPRIAAHIELVNANKGVRKSWKLLKAYIRKAYKKPLQNVRLNDAGYGYYSNVGKDNWESTLTLITMATEFMTTYLDELTANDNMPSTFPADFAAAAALFNAERNVFLSKSKQAQEGTSIKDKSLREVEEHLSSLLEIGKSIFEEEPDNLKKFTFADLLKRVRGNEQSGLKGKVLDQANASPIVGVVVSNGINSVTTNEEGKYFLPMPSGKHDITFTAMNYQGFVLENKLIKVGVKSQYTANLSAIEIPAAIALEQIVSDMASQTTEEAPATDGAEETGTKTVSTV